MGSHDPQNTHGAKHLGFQGTTLSWKWKIVILDTIMLVDFYYLSILWFICEKLALKALCLSPYFVFFCPQYFVFEFLLSIKRTVFVYSHKNGILIVLYRITVCVYTSTKIVIYLTWWGGVSRDKIVLTNMKEQAVTPSLFIVEI